MSYGILEGMPTLITSFVASTPAESWIESFEKGQLFAFFSMSSSSDKRMLLARTVFNNIVESYYSSHSADNFKKLKYAFEETYELVGEGQLFVGVFFESRVFCVARGGPSVKLIRDKHQSTLLRSAKDEPKSLSGFVKPGDIFVCGSSTFFDAVTDEVLIASLSKREMNEIGSFISPILATHNNGSMGAWFFKVFQSFEDESPSHNLPVQTHANTEELSKHALYVRSPVQLSEPSTKRAPLFVGGILIVLLLISIIWGTKAREKKEKEKAFQERIVAIESALEESVNLANINPQKAQELYQSAQEQIKNISYDPIHTDEVHNLESKIEELQEKILGQKEVSLSLFVDLSLLSDGFTTSNVAFGEDKIFVFDKEHKRIAKVGLLGKRAEIVAGPSSAEGIVDITSYVDTLYGLGINGIYQIIPKKQKVIDEKWDNALVYAYTGNLYILDRIESQIYRYQGSTGYAQKWFSDNVSEDLLTAKQWIIDGTIWVLKEDGVIKRFSNGNSFPFSLYGVVPVVNHPTALYTNESSENLYVLDAENTRIGVFTKGGEFITQYVGEGLKDGKFIVVSEKDKKAFVITNDKVFSMEMEK